MTSALASSGLSRSTGFHGGVAHCVGVDRLAVVVRVEDDGLASRRACAARRTPPAARRSATRAAASRCRALASFASGARRCGECSTESLARFGMCEKVGELAHDRGVVRRSIRAHPVAKRDACGRRLRTAPRAAAWHASAVTASTARLRCATMRGCCHVSHAVERRRTVPNGMKRFHRELAGT